MERFVESLYNRLDDEKKMQLTVIMDNAINEMHNNGILNKLSPEAFEKVHNPDPNVRLNEKTSLAKSVGYSFVSESKPLIAADGQASHKITVEFNPAFVYSICLCLQGGLEGLFLSGIYKQNRSGIVRYIIRVSNYNEITDLFKSNIEVLNHLYDNFCIEIMSCRSEKEHSKDDNAEIK